MQTRPIPAGRELSHRLEVVFHSVVVVNGIYVIMCAELDPELKATTAGFVS